MWHLILEEYIIHELGLLMSVNRDELRETYFCLFDCDMGVDKLCQIINGLFWLIEGKS